MRGSAGQSAVRITPYQFTVVRIVVGLSLAAYFIGMHVGYSRLQVSVPLAIPRGGEWREFLQSGVLAANASTWFCITGVAASLLLALGYYRRVVSALILLRLLVVIYGHWLQALSIIFPVLVLFWFCVLPRGEPAALLQPRRPDWQLRPTTARAFWLSASVATGVFLTAALLLQIRLIEFQTASQTMRLLKWSVLGGALAAVLAANPWLTLRQRTRGITWAVNLVVLPGLALVWFSDRQLQLLPRLWLPWGLSTGGLYFLVWFVLLDRGLLPGRPAVAGKQHIVFYDGRCPLCNKALDLVIREDADGLLHFAPLQGKTAERVLDDEAGEAAGEKGTVVYVRNTLDNAGEVWRRSDAVVQMLRDGGGFFGFAASIMGLLPRSLRDFAYRRIAGWRRRVFGQYDSCPAPPAAAAERFLP